MTVTQTMKRAYQNRPNAGAALDFGLELGEFLGLGIEAPLRVTTRLPSSLVLVIV